MQQQCASPLWLLRLSHTRLTDAILDLCEVPQNESSRRACYNILSRCAAPPPSLLQKNNSKQNRKKDRHSTRALLDELLKRAETEHGLPAIATKRLRAFLTKGACLPLPTDVYTALDSLQDGTKKLRALDEQRPQLPRRKKRYEDVARGLRAVRNLIDAMGALGILPRSGCKINSEMHGNRYHPPLYISLDLGMRQPRKHYHGHFFFQAIMLPDELDLLEINDALLAAKDKGVKIAEGGRYDDLVRRFRPPGNFATSQVDQYTSASIPFCTGVRFFVGRLVARTYFEAALLSRQENENIASLTAEADILRRVLAHPFASTPTVKCIVVGMNGFDSATLSERAIVAAHLWAEGISGKFEIFV